MANHRKVFLEITNRCNLSCAFCPGTERPVGRLDEEAFTLLAGKVTGWAEYLYFHLMGEPTAHPLLPRFIEIAAGMGMRPMITTNGTLLASRGDALLGKTPPYKVSISLHAFEANPPGMSFEDYIDGCIRFAARAAKRGVISVLRLWNLDGRADGALNRRNEQILSALHTAFPGEWRKNRSGFKLAERVFLEWGEKFDWPERSGRVLQTEGFCWALRDQIGVLCDGTVVPCCLDRDGDIPLGNLFDQTLEEILASQRARAMFDSFTAHRCAEPLCKRCMRAGYYRQN